MFSVALPVPRAVGVGEGTRPVGDGGKMASLALVAGYFAPSSPCRRGRRTVR